MKLTNEIDLHDALVNGIDINCETRGARIDVELYVTAGDRKRVCASILFEGVDSISQICDFAQMKKNTFAGNVNYWSPGKAGGTTYIYLVDGCISIKAKKVSIERHQESKESKRPASK